MIKTILTRVILSSIFLWTLSSCSTTGIPVEITAEEDYQSSLEEFKSLEDPDAKNQVWFSFLERQIDSKYAIGRIRYLAFQHFLELKNDPDGAVEFVNTSLEKIKDESVRARGESLIIRILGRTGKKDELADLTEKLRQKNQLTLKNSEFISNAAIEAEAWELAEDVSQHILDRANPASIREDQPDEQLDEKQVREDIDRYRRIALFNLGQAQSKLDKNESAIASFEAMKDLVSINYAGFTSYPTRDFDIYYYEALMKQGHYEKALKVIGPRALVLQGDEKAEEAFRRAYISQGGSESGYADFSQKEKKQIVKTIPEFSAYDYDGNQVSFSDLSKKATLLVFWFPT